MPPSPAGFRDAITPATVTGSVLFVLCLAFWFAGYAVGYGYLTGVMPVGDTTPIWAFTLVLVFALGWFLLAMSRRLIAVSAVRGAVLFGFGLIAIVVCAATSVYLLAVRPGVDPDFTLQMLVPTYMAVLGVVSLLEGFREFSKTRRTDGKGASTSLWARVRGAL